MLETLPKSPGALRWVLARKLAYAVLIIGLVASGISYRFETYRVEQAALERAEEGARHFESPAMQMVADKTTSEKHDDLAQLVDRNQFVGIRVFGNDKALVYETWADIPTALIDTARSQKHDWPLPGNIHRHWSEAAGQRLIQVVLPLIGKDGTLDGYMESVSRLDEKTLQAQRDQIFSGVLTATLSILITAILLYPLLLAMLRQSARLSHRLLDSNLSLMHSLGNAIAKRDSDTDAHNYRVTYYAVALAEAMKVPHADIENLVVGAFLHDVGKIGIPDSILLKPGKLSVEEFEVMKTHVQLGIEIVAGNPWLTGAAQTIHCHHERFDGTGYPQGLRGEAIPLTARIFAVADVFDALTSERPYKKPIAFAEAMTIMEAESNRHFDAKAMSVFGTIASNLYAWTLKASDASLQNGMRETLFRYFKMESAPKGADSRSKMKFG